MADFKPAIPGGGPVSVGDLPAEAMLTTTYDVNSTGVVGAAETIKDRLILTENVTAGQLVYLSADPLVAGVASGGVADRLTATKRPSIAVALETGTTGQTISILQNGLASLDTSSFAVGDVVSLGLSGAIELNPDAYNQQIGVVRVADASGQLLVQQGSYEALRIDGSPSEGEFVGYDSTKKKLVSTGMVNQGPNKIKTNKEFFAKKLKTEPASIEIGEGVILSNGGSEILQHSFSTSDADDHAFLPRKRLDFVLGTEGNFTTGRVIGVASEVVLQGIDALRSDDPSAAVGLNIVPGKVTYPVTVTEDRLITKFFTRFDTVQTGIRFVIRITDENGPVIFVTNTDETWEGGEGFTSIIYTGSPATETVIDVSQAPLVVLKDVTYHVTVESNVGDIVMLGDVVAGPEYNPYFRRNLQSLADDPVVAGRPVPVSSDLIMSSNQWYSTIYVDATSGNRTVTLPTAVGALSSELPVRVYKTDSTTNTVTVLPFGAETISGEASVLITKQHDAVTIISDGLEARLFSHHMAGIAQNGGIFNDEANATSSTTTASSTDVLVGSMTLTPGEGDYIVWFSSSFEADTTGQTVFVSLYFNGSQVATTERRYYIDGSIPDTAIPVATHDMYTALGTGESIEVRWRVTGGTAKMYQRKLTIIKVG